MAFVLGDLFFENGKVSVQEKDVDQEHSEQRFPPGTPCTCPGDCNCRMPDWMFRMVFCGCRQH